MSYLYLIVILVKCCVLNYLLNYIIYIIKKVYLHMYKKFKIYYTSKIILTYNNINNLYTIYYTYIITNI